MSNVVAAVAEILGCAPDTLPANAALGETPHWDSFAQLRIMMFLEEQFGIAITDDTIRQYSALAAIQALED